MSKQIEMGGKRYASVDDMMAEIEAEWAAEWRITHWFYAAQRAIHNTIYYIKCRLWHRWNVIRIKSLPPTWNDRDQVMLHAAFQVLTDFIEREDTWQTPQEVYDDYIECGQDVAQGRRDVRAEINSLYEWWRDRQNDYGDRKEDDENLCRLVGIRKHLWT